MLVEHKRLGSQLVDEGRLHLRVTVPELIVALAGKDRETRGVCERCEQCACVCVGAPMGVSEASGMW